MQARTGISMATAMLLAGCQPKPPEVPPAPPAPMPHHVGPPPAHACAVGPFQVADGGSASVAMTVSNEGGYCAATLTAANGKPFDAPLVTVLPDHGTPRVVKYYGKTSVEYTPTAGFTGHDSFVVHLLQRGAPGYTTLNMSVTIGP